MNLLKLNPEVIEMIKEIVDRLKKPVITERRLRGICRMEKGKQVKMIKGILGK